MPGGVIEAVKFLRLHRCSFEQQPARSTDRDQRHANGESKMQARATTEVQARIIAVVESILAQNSIATRVAPDSNLADIGLASIDMVNLMLGVEAAFDLMIPQGDITPENFRSVATIEHLILKHRQSKAA